MAMRPQLGVGLDCGSHRTRCVVLLLEDDYVRFLGAGEAPGAGWTRGRLVDAEALTQSVQKAVENAERHAQTLVDAVVVGVGGEAVHSCAARGVYEMGPAREIDSEDVMFSMRLASQATLDNDRCLLQVFPQEFLVDGRGGFRNPRRATGERLEAIAHLITASRQEHDALVAAIQHAHLHLEETVFESFAAAYASVLEAERRRGVLVIDIGQHSTELVIFDGEAVVASASLRLGGEHFTRDLAAIFRVSPDDAEMLKREHGCARLGLTSDYTFIEIPSSEGRPSREARRLDLNEVLEARAEELFRLVKHEVVRAGMEKRLMEGAVLCGGGALLNGMEDMAEVILNCQARKALPLGIDEWPDELNRADWTTAAGLALYSAKLKTRIEFRRRAPGFMGLVFK